MTPDELHALAEALDPSGKVLTHPGDSALQRAAAYLRAQADAQPVAWMALAYGLPSQATTDEPTAIRWRKAGGDVVPLYAHPAPAAPQAEPKREPVSEATALIEWPESAKWKNRAAPEGIERSCMAEPKREPLSDWRITKGEYVLATKFSDGDPGDHWGVGFYDRFENGRHYVVDSAGKQIRGNGFRRAGRITADVGRWLLSAAKSLEASPPGTVNLWTMLTKRAYGIGGSDAE